MGCGGGKLSSFSRLSLSLHGFALTQSVPLHNSALAVFHHSVIEKKQIWSILQFYECFEKMRLRRHWKSLSLHMTIHSQPRECAPLGVLYKVQSVSLTWRKWICSWKKDFLRLKGKLHLKNCSLVPLLRQDVSIWGISFFFFNNIDMGLKIFFFSFLKMSW